MAMNERRCPSCKTGSLRAVKNHPHSMHIAGSLIEGSVDALRCGACGEVLISAAELRRFEVLAASEVIRAGWLKGGVLRAARKALGFPAVRLGLLLGVTPETVSRWENDNHDVPRAVFLWLYELLMHHAHGGDARGRRRKKPPRLGRTLRHDATEPLELAAKAPHLRLVNAA